MGFTANKTTKLLQCNSDKIIIINDAHSLVQHKNDVFGIEAIDAINNFITQNNDIIIIFN